MVRIGTVGTGDKANRLPPALYFGTYPTCLPARGCQYTPSLIFQQAAGAAGQHHPAFVCRQAHLVGFHRRFVRPGDTTLKDVAQHGRLQPRRVTVDKHKQRIVAEYACAQIHKVADVLFDFPHFAVASASVTGWVHNDGVVTATAVDFAFDKLAAVIHDVPHRTVGKSAEEDPTFTVRSDHETGQTVISGMGELHLDIIVDRLRREFGVEINQGAPQVNYKEAITATVQHREVFKKQTGGRGKFADIIVEIGPADEGVTGLQFDNQVKGGNIPKEFIPCIEKGFKAAMSNGVLAGYEVQSMKVTVLDGSFHPVDSDQLSFEMAGRLAFRHACPKAKPVLLEPIMSLEVVTPEDYMGDIVGDLNRRRGQIQAMDSTANGARIVRAFVPLAEQFGYVTVLRTLSSGRATSTMTFDHYAEVPANLAKDVIEKSGYKLSDDDE